MDDADMYRIQQTTTIYLTGIKISHAKEFAIDENTGEAKSAK